MPFSDLVNRAAQVIHGARYAVVLTGAGISTESGIPDFRSPGTGLWETEDPDDFTIDSFQRDPHAFYRRMRPLLDLINKACPNEGHKVLAEMEGRGMIQAVITQNIDGLHQLAGSRRVLEVHGTFRTATCRSCRQKNSIADLLFFLDRGEEPDCPHCGGSCKPDVVLFGEDMPRAFQEAHKEAMRCDCMIVVGSSLQVLPVGHLPRYSKELIIINRGTTPYDEDARVVFRASASEALRQVLTELDRLAKINK